MKSRDLLRCNSTVPRRSLTFFQNDDIFLLRVVNDIPKQPLTAAANMLTRQEKFEVSAACGANKMGRSGLFLSLLFRERAL